MPRLIGLCLAVLLATAGSAGAQMPPRPDAVKPNGQNLMEGPSYWTPGQRRLNVPGANANPTLRRNNPVERPVPAPAPRQMAPPKPRPAI